MLRPCPWAAKVLDTGLGVTSRYTQSPLEYEKKILEAPNRPLLTSHKPNLGHTFVSRSIIGVLNRIIITGLDQIEYFLELP